MTGQSHTLPFPRTASLIGGIALLLVAVLAGVGYVGILSPLIESGDAVKTAHDIADSEPLFRLGVLLMITAAVLDIMVAAALLALLGPVNRAVAMTAASFRVAYSVVFVVALTQLAIVPGLLDQPDSVQTSLASYHMIWQVGLILFAAHLLLVGYLVIRSGFMPGTLGILITIAGVGYLADAIGTVLIADYTARISTVTFIGEVALIVWLLWTTIRWSRVPQETKVDGLQVSRLATNDE
ncbi:DUF4386 domain-containing protein [Cryobacterium sp. PH31-AA6]|uniref:DUF4386 domain-containing protein n=1 Tax=Cryobacterium sp. PH31-AA6 TaxID=3046205 RepID=UPI0024BA7ED6|nr:DUF4386 domain-containing protein [Cryobacterium sp. PH31-AA6]MDJ0323670.1 DUF4386 domain-containing protein [Cryobacterium sp. PH31-AA6]